MQEYGFNFADNQDITSDFSGGVVSSNVFDAGSAIKKFEGDPGQFEIGLDFISSTHDPVVEIRLLGADDAALTSNPIILGTYKTPALASTALPHHGVIKPGFQKTAKRYYGLWAVGDDSSARVKYSGYGCLNSQSNLVP